MKIYTIVLFIVIVNMAIQLVNMLDLTIADYAESQDTATLIRQEEAAEKISATVGENQGGIIGALNWLTENVYLAIQGIGAFITLILNSTLFSYNTYYKFLCYGGVDCSVGAFMWNFAAMLSTLTYVAYTIALIQFATGKSMRDME